MYKFNLSKMHHIGGWVHDDSFILDLGKPEVIRQCDDYFRK
jgi:hypothetical protein